MYLLRKVVMCSKLNLPAVCLYMFLSLCKYSKILKLASDIKENNIKDSVVLSMYFVS